MKQLIALGSLCLGPFIQPSSLSLSLQANTGQKKFYLLQSNAISQLIGQLPSLFGTSQLRELALLLFQVMLFYRNTKVFEVFAHHVTPLRGIQAMHFVV